jgi:hypothetical protein
MSHKLQAIKIKSLRLFFVLQRVNHVVDVEQAWGDEFTLRRYHDQVLSYGSPPVKFVRALILNEDIPRSAN